jgi:hypothetical protein
MTIPTVAGRRFNVGKYEIVATPIARSAQMLRYTVFLDGKRIGALVSVPSESDCRFLEAPPAVPELVPWKVIYRPGRPRKDAPPRSTEPLPAPREELPHGLELPTRSDER